MRLPTLLLLTTILSTSQAYGPSPLWDENENRDTYVHFPDEMKAILDQEFHVLMRSPQLNVFSTVPEPAERIWPLIKGMTLRNHLDNKILWSVPNYLVTDGLVYGCREMVDGKEEHMPVESALCEDHCTHQGRYCAPFLPSAMPEELPAGFKGRELVKESLRRLCFDKYYHASDTKYFEYLEGFDRQQCLQRPDVTECALQVIMGVDHADYSNLRDCVDEPNWDNDVVNDMLEKQLTDATKMGVTLENLPQLRIGGYLYEGEYSTAGIFARYCASFKDREMHPISCDVCGECHDVRKCLWTLECDGEPLDPLAFLSSYGGNPEPEEPSEPEIPQTQETVVEEPSSATATLPPEAVTPNLSSDNSSKEQEFHAKEVSNDKEALKMFAIILVVCLSIVAGLAFYREKRSRQLMKEAFEESRQTQYHDSEIYSDNVVNAVVDDNDHDEIDFEMSPTRGVARHASSQPPRMAFLPEVS